MNIAIVGNSNCVFRNGLSYGVEQFASEVGGRVANYSLGGSCCALHIYTLHARYHELVSSDLVILDSLIIDTAHWRRGIVNYEELRSLIDDMYGLYSNLPGKVVSVLFPGEKDLKNYHFLETYKAHMDAAKKYGVDVVDLYKLIPSGVDDYSIFFMHPGHIKTEIACVVGYRIASLLQGEAEARQKNCEFISPYRVVSGELFAGLESVAVASSHFMATCYKLDKKVSMDAVAGMELIGALHWNKDSCSKLVVSSEASEDVIHCRSQYAFFEVLKARRVISAGCFVRPGGEWELLTQRAAGNGSDTGHGVPQIAGLLLKGSNAVKAAELGANSELSSLIGNVFAEALA